MQFLEFLAVEEDRATTEDLQEEEEDLQEEVPGPKVGVTGKSEPRGFNFDIVREAMGRPMLALQDGHVDVDLHVEGVLRHGATDDEEGVLALTCMIYYCTSHVA